MKINNFNKKLPFRGTTNLEYILVEFMVEIKYLNLIKDRFKVVKYLIQRVSQNYPKVELC